VKYVRPNATSAEYNNYCHRAKIDKDGKYSWGMRGEFWCENKLAEKLSHLSSGPNPISDLNYYHKSNINNNNHSFKIIEYNDEVCQFFIDFNLQVLTLTDKLKNIFNNENKSLIEFIKEKEKTHLLLEHIN